VRCLSAAAAARRAEAVRDTTPADRDAPVLGALQVDVSVRAVAERLAARPADLPPELLPEWLGDDHRAVHRHERSSQAPQIGGVALSRAHDPSRSHRTGWRDRFMWADLA